MITTSTTLEREQLENEAELFSLLLTCDCLEKLYVRDVIRSEEYQIN